MPTKEEFELLVKDKRASAGRSPERDEAMAKADAVRSEEMANLQGHPGWERIKSHSSIHDSKIEDEIKEIKEMLTLAIKEEDLRALQMRHAYKRGYADGMKTILNAPADLSKPTE